MVNPEDLDPGDFLAKHRGKSTQAFLQLVPSLVAELTQQIIENRDLRVRDRLRTQIRGIFNTIFADTLYPPEAEKDAEDLSEQEI